jgi:hypothetical protein
METISSKQGNKTGSCYRVQITLTFLFQELAMATQIDTRQLFDTIVLACRSTSLPFNPTPKELDLMYHAFLGIFDKRQAKVRKSPLPWKGWKAKDGSINEDSRIQSLQSAFYYLFHFHSGRTSAYIGTLLNANQKLGIIFSDLDFIPYPQEEVRDWWKLDISHPDYKTLTEKRDANRAAEKQFVDYCDSFCQVAIFLFTKGKTTSRNGDIWRKALGSYIDSPAINAVT